ncbi:MAG: AtpZ/AtpI family protein [Chloroflexi bacterium]|nr:AtpZ/AtpI family protein [Chloroflexota bacterium]
MIGGALCYTSPPSHLATAGNALTILKTAVIALEAGTAMAVAVLVGLFIGMQIDDRLGIHLPIFAILGPMIGLASGAYSFGRVAQFMKKPKGE